MKKDNKTVCIKLRFFTDGLKLSIRDRGQVACWENGMAILENNQTKGLKGQAPLPFNCYEDILPIIKEIFRKNRIVVASCSRRPRVLSARRRAE